MLHSYFTMVLLNINCKFKPNQNPFLKIPHQIFECTDVAFYVTMVEYSDGLNFSVPWCMPCVNTLPLSVSETLIMTGKALHDYIMLCNTSYSQPKREIFLLALKMQTAMFDKTNGKEMGPPIAAESNHWQRARKKLKNTNKTKNRSSVLLLEETEISQ